MNGLAKRFALVALTVFGAVVLWSLSLLEEPADYALFTSRAAEQ